MPGEFSDVKSLVKCKKCLVGTFSRAIEVSEDGPTTCEECPAGFSQSLLGQASCFPCVRK